VGDQYIDSSGFILTITRIDKEDDTLYVDDLEKRYGDWHGLGAIFSIDSFKIGMQRL
jgi:hypothetical protein